MSLTRLAPFAFRIVERSKGRAAIIYRRKPNDKGQDRLQKIAMLSPLGLTAGASLLRDAASRSVIAGKSPVHHHPELNSGSGGGALKPGKYYPLDSDWGSRVACYAIVVARLRNAERLMKAASHMREADPDIAAWWLGMLQNGTHTRALRALRILTEAVP
ncbi:MAG: hypothetical protein QHI38_07770 [Armatimonadota bacterium]|nr:hypothetical protein [Armatimonadota bacterium]